MEKTRLEAHEKYSEMLYEAFDRGGAALEKEVMRSLCRTDLFYLLRYQCYRADLDRDWLYDRCREVQQEPDEYLDLWAREHYKSTIITYGKTMQDILVDPEITGSIFSFNRPIAKAFLRQIKREFELNEGLKHLFDDILWADPKKESPKWSEDDGIVVKRKGNPKEATLEAWGLVDGQPTSKHFGLMIYDDIVTRDSVTTPEMIQKVNDAWELSRSLKTEGGRSRYAGTRYHYNDTYSLMMERKSARPRIYPAEIDGAPVLMSAEELAKRRVDQGPRTYSCQMLLDPKADSTIGFNIEWVKYWPARQYKGLNLYLLCDPANKKKKTNDYTCFILYGLGADKNYYIVHMIRDRLNLVERARTLFWLVRTYNPLMVGYEEYGLQADTQHYEDKMSMENYRFTIIPLGGKMAKEDRIMGLQAPFSAGRVYLPEICVHRDYEGNMVDMTRTFIYDEFLPFPVASHDDMLDCMARMVDPQWEVYTSFPLVSPEIIGTNMNDPVMAEAAIKAQQTKQYNPLTYGLGGGR